MGAARQGQAPVFLYASQKGRQTGTFLYLTCKSGIYAVLKLYFGAEPRGIYGAMEFSLAGWGVLKTFSVFFGCFECAEIVLINPAIVCVSLMLSCCCNRFCISCNRHEAFLKSFR